MNHKPTTVGARLCAFFAACVAGVALAGPFPDTTIPFLPDVEDQFAKLALRPEGLAFRLGAAPEPNQCQHYQGVARSTGPGTPYLFVSWSGNQTSPDFCGVDDHPGALLVVRLGTRDTNGERLRSNRLQRGLDILLTPPREEDVVVTTIRFDGVSGWPNYGHPGGMQMVGDVLVLALEGPYETGAPPNVVLFINVEDPENPVLLDAFDEGTVSGFSAGLVAVTSVLTEAGDLRYVMLVTGETNETVRVYRSRSADLSSSGWDLVATRSESQLESCLGADWHTGKGDAHQMLNFVREGSQTGPLYLIGGRNADILPSGDDFIDLYRVGMDAYGNPDDCLLRHLRSTHVTSHPVMGGGDSGNFAAASGTYVSPSLELIIYSTEFENDGISDGLRKTVRFGEWRHREMVRADNPTLRPTAEVHGPFTVDEGGSVALAGTGAPPQTKAWLQLFEDDGAGLSLPPFGDKDDWLVVDYDDWAADDFDDFGKEDFSDDAGSWRWFAPDGCTLRVNDDDFGDGDFPGKFTRRLPGTGRVEEERNLDNVPNDDGDYSMDDEITSMQFFGNCDRYYAAAIGLSWDLDGNGSFEAQGDTVTFSALELDGPSTHVVNARGEHPRDGTALGLGEPVPASVVVANVPPAIGATRLVDSLGLEVGVAVPFALQGLTYHLEGTFTDAGRPDTQTASIAWGDGAQEDDTSFDVFSDAFGGATGQIRHGHVWGRPGTFDVVLAVADDDGGSSTVEHEIRVLDATAAVAELAQQLADLIGSTTDPRAQAALIEALTAIIGNNGGRAENGALDKLESGITNAALVKMLAALGDIETAEAKGAGDLTAQMTLLTVAARSLAYKALYAAVAASRPPSAIAAIQTAIAAGDAFLAAGDFEAALGAYRRAV